MSKEIILKFLNCQSCTIFFFIEYEKSASLHSPRPPLALAFREVLTFTSIRMETHKIAISRLGRGLDLPLCKNISNFLKCQWSLETSFPPREIQEKFSLPGVFYEDFPFTEWSLRSLNSGSYLLSITRPFTAYMLPSSNWRAHASCPTCQALL